MDKRFVSFFALTLIFTGLLLAHFQPTFAQTITPSPAIDQSSSIANDSLNSQTPAASNQTLLPPDQQAFDNLPNPGILPDSPFYFLKRWGENIQTFFTVDDYQRAQLELHFAQLRLAEAKVELEKNNTNLTDQMLSDYNKDIQTVSTATQKLSTEGKEVTGLISTIKRREGTRLALLDDQLSKTTDPGERQKIQRNINFITRQSQTNINRLVHAVTHTPSYQPSANQTVSGQVTALNSPNFTIQTPGNKQFVFSTDATTVFKEYGASGSAMFANLATGVYIYVTFPRQGQLSSVSGTPPPSVTPSPAVTQTPSVILAKRVVIGVPQSLIIPLTGTIANFSPSSFTLQTASGQAYAIRVNMQTVYHSNRDDATASGVHTGSQVRIYAVPLPEQNIYLAKVIYVVLPRKLSRTGTLTQINGPTITVNVRNQTAYTFTLTGSTVVQKNGRPDSSTDLVVNESVTVSYDGNVSDTTGSATNINIHAPRQRTPKTSITPAVSLSPVQSPNPSPTQTQ